MKFMRRTADGYIWWDFKENTEILEELKSPQFNITFRIIKRTGEIMWTGCLDQGYAEYTKRKKRSGQTYEETDKWILRPEQANIGLHPWQLHDDDDDTFIPVSE
jgi:hypothetical protein